MAACGCGLVRLLAVKKRARPQRPCLHQMEQDHTAVAGARPQDHRAVAEAGPQDHRAVAEAGPQDHRAVAEAGPQDHRAVAAAGPQSCGRSRTTELWQQQDHRAVAAAGPQDHRALAGLEALTWERPVISYVENASAYKQRKVKKLVVISQARSGSVVEEDLPG